jgi:hypothetical protein
LISSNQSQIQGASFQALHFQSSASNLSLSAKAMNGVIHVSGLERSLSPPQIVQKSTSATSLGARDDEAEVGIGRLLVPEFASTPPAIVDFVDSG